MATLGTLAVPPAPPNEVTTMKKHTALTAPTTTSEKAPRTLFRLSSKKPGAVCGGGGVIVNGPRDGGVIVNAD